ncbi:MAG: polyphosphate kinase 1, partial [Pseudomonadota bacterium]
KARFDEERNIYWAQKMEKAGIHVVYGVIGFKTHSKTALVLRKEASGIMAYSHIGTGNYNSSTAKIYTDVGLLTANPKITKDVVQLFHFLTGRSFQREFESLLVAPMNMKARFLELINNETKAKMESKPASIMAKFNSMEDREICDALYKASQAGVKVDLVVRGFCCLKPQVPGLSENIRVVSIVDRFLEHSRLFFFQNQKDDPLDGLVYLGSADWMRRNLHGRVEVITPIFDRVLKRRCLEIMKSAFEDPVSGWELQKEGHYLRREGQPNEVSSQRQLMQLTKMRSQSISHDD